VPAAVVEGSEAVMKALMIARAYATKEKIIKIEGGYLFHHGVSLAHTEEDVRKIIDVFGKGLDAINN
jgi:glutamate-1-semialdehyde aminotransferase